MVNFHNVLHAQGILQGKGTPKVDIPDVSIDIMDIFPAMEDMAIVSIVDNGIYDVSFV